MFESGEVTQAEINELLEATRWAPTHKLTQPWRFYVFTGEAKIELARQQGKAYALAKGDSPQTATKQKRMADKAQQSAAVIAVVMRRDPEERIPEFEEMCAVSCAVQNMWLHAPSMGLGGYWSTGAATDSPEMRALLGLQPKDRHLGWFYLGRYTGEVPGSVNRNETESFVKWMG